MRNRLFTLLFLLGNLASSQQITIEDLEFDSETERSFYEDVLNGDQEALFGSFMSMIVPNKETIDGAYNSFQTQLDEIKQLKKPKNEEKHLKNVYNELHDRFLRKYEDLVHFNRIFESGVYNCVTACAIYGLSFDELGIPYSIKETPTHVYLVAFPGNDQIVIETTDPVKGFKTFNPTFKSNFVMTLANQKLIDRAELEGGVDYVFNKYYYSKKDISLTELVGIHYYNHGIELAQKSEFKKANNQFRKAYLLYPSEEISTMLLNSGLGVISKTEYKDDSDMKILIELAQFEESTISNSDILGEFGRVTQFQLRDRNDTVTYKKSYATLRQNLTDSSLIRNIGVLFNYEMARILYNRANYSISLPYALEAYRLKPENPDNENLLLNCFLRRYQSKTSSEALAFFDDLMNSNDIIRSNNHFGAVWLTLILEVMTNEISERRITKGLEHKKRFEELTEKYPNYKYDDYTLGRAYSQAVVYYFKRGQMTNARRVLNQGLKYSPENNELKTRKYMLNRN